MSDLRRLFWLCRDPQPPVGGPFSKRRFEHHLFTGKPERCQMPSGREAFVATARARYVGEIILPVRGLKSLRPGDGRWVRLTLEVP